MKKEEALFRAVGEVDDSLVEEAEPVAAESRRRRPAPWIALAACLVLVAGVGAYSWFGGSSPTETLPQVVVTAPASPAGIRPFFNYGGYRYAFVEEGAAFNLDMAELSEPLGTLEHDITAGMNGGGNPYASLDFATTYALGGTVHQVSFYHPEFRLAVHLNGTVYLAERVGGVDGSPLELTSFFEAGRLYELITRIEILNHMGTRELGRIQQDGVAQDFVALLARSTPAELSGEDYGEIAAAQMGGRSFLLLLGLRDGSAVNIRLLPDLGLVSVGDSYYHLTAEFLGEFLDVFADLTGDAPLPMM